MKILRQPDLKTGPRLTAPKHGENGMATLVFITLLAIMMILVTAEARALFHLHREVKFLEQQQIKRLNGNPASAPVAAKPESK
jgi:hypothetical protein